MPTVILLDLSLSMFRPLILPDGTEVTRKQLAVHGIQVFLDHLSIHSKLEFISLVTFSSLYEEKWPFTRDYSLIKAELKNLEDFDKSCIETALHGVNQIVLAEWGNNTACQVILITDGNIGFGHGSLKESLNTLHQRTTKNPFALPFSFPAKLHIVCLTQPSDPNLIRGRPAYQKLLELCGPDGTINIPELQFNEQTITTMFQKLADDMYTTFKGVLKCGQLESNILLSPVPIPYLKVSDFEYKNFMINKTMEVCGFIPIPEIGSPMAVSRHLILPATTNMKEKISVDPEIDLLEISEDDKTPSFCVLLHGALKVENMAALVQIDENWFGFVYSWADSKKKSNLMLTILQPGADCVPWLGDLRNLHCSEGIPSDTLLNFPIKSSEKRSYSQNGVVWIRQAGLQSDIQKILRHAKKLPEKTPQFYKELNRLRKAAIQLGFLDLLNCLAYIFDQECTQLPGTAHPDCALQLTHAADSLRKPQNRDLKFGITPLQTNFNNSS